MSERERGDEFGHREERSSIGHIMGHRIWIYSEFIENVLESFESVSRSQ